MAHCVCEQLRNWIIAKKFAPGSRLNIESMSAELGISRTPLREALAMLEQEGLVQLVPYQGFSVATVSPEERKHILQVRGQLEILAIELAIDHIPLEEIDRVVSFIHDNRTLLQKGDHLAHVQCNWAVHTLAPSYCGNPLLLSIVQSLERKLAIHLASSKSGDIAWEMDEHLDILHALRERNQRKAIELLTEHIRLA